jgi:hypothetical protein
MPCEGQIPCPALCLKDLQIRNVILYGPERVIDKAEEEEHENGGKAGVKVKSISPCNKQAVDVYRVVRC